jgi:hypothetical protein
MISNFRMKQILNNTLVLIFVLVFSSCGVDEIIPCSADAMHSGKLCREYRYSNGTPVGFVDYSYSGDTIIDRTFFDNDGNLVKSITERYSNGLLQAKVERFETGITIVGSYHYLSNDSLECIVFGPADSSQCLSYVNGKRVKVEYFHGESRKRYQEYRYYEDDERLFRISYFNQDDSLVQYHSYSYYFGGIVRIDYASSSHTPLGYTVLNFSDEQFLETSQFTDTTGQITHRLEQVYNASNRLSESIEESTFGTSRILFMYN